MVALGRLMLSKRERVIALEPYDKGLLGTTLRYLYEVRKAEDYFCDLPDRAKQYKPPQKKRALRPNLQTCNNHSE
jgi:non-homologous end joining protein Ku